MNPSIILSSGSGNQDPTKSLKELFTNPILYAVLGGIILLIIVFYLVRRFVKAKPNASIIVLRGGKVYKVIDESNPKCYLVPFRDAVGAVINHDEKEFSSDQLFINNGPDALYKVNYTLKYQVKDPKAFYPYIEKLPILLPKKINDELRLYADEGNALKIVKDYRQNEKVIIDLINKAVEECQIEVGSIKVNSVEPLGRA